jgi:3-dehydroquinate synthase
MGSSMEQIRVHLEKERDDSYDIFVGREIMDRAASVIRAQWPADQYVVITDSNVNRLYGELVEERLRQGGLVARVIEIPAGESSKSMGTALDVATQLLEFKASRQSLLIALGGGVVGDLAGFVASIYKRSVPYVQVATTLVAQVDSSVGGKTGIDLQQGKNLLGTFYQPRAVFIDLSFLKTLTDRDFKNGLAEIIKYGIISDVEMFSLLEGERTGVIERQAMLMEELVVRSCKTKARIVEQDEKEGDLRRILNFGHTLGHALEAASGYGLSHGEAVAIGTVGASMISQKLGFLDEASHGRIVRLVEQYGLPTEIPDRLNTKDLLDFMASDKKAVGKTIHFVLVKKIGTPFVTAGVPIDIIKEVIEEIRP